MVIVTGAAGFIGSNLVAHLNHAGIDDIVVSDDFSVPAKFPNLEGKKCVQQIHREHLFDFIHKHHSLITFVFHLGARTDTTEFDRTIFDKLNVGYSQSMFVLCSRYQLPLVYASSAATYGAGEYGYDDSDDSIHHLKPLNPYGDSKHQFDLWALQQVEAPPFWAGLKFFNVYGPNEYHKQRMASVIYHASQQIKQHGVVKLFRSHLASYKDGEQLRDFIYVKDVTAVCLYLMQRHIPNGVYNLGTGKARTFLSLVNATFHAMHLEPHIEWIDIPIDIRDKYQYYTQANMTKLLSNGYSQPFYTLEQGVADYVTNYLLPSKYI